MKFAEIFKKGKGTVPQRLRYNFFCDICPVWWFYERDFKRIKDRKTFHLDKDGFNGGCFSEYGFGDVREEHVAYI